MEEQNGPLQGRTALVTGAAKRLGRTVSLALADAGADVIVHYGQSEDDAEELIREIQDKGRQAWKAQLDLSQPRRAGKLWAEVTDRAGTIDILVNNASIFPPSRVLTFSAEELHRNVQINAFAPLELCRLFAEQDCAGHIVNFLDARMVDYDEYHVAYHLSKRMLYSLTRMLALELAPQVQVNAVAPGLVLPPAGQGEDYLARLASTNPLNRHGRPEDIAEAVLFLLKSDFVTGQVLFIDGGRHLKGRVYG
ncbi:MAG: SDR family oxidoreductase [Planctomycetota bacterium]